MEWNEQQILYIPLNDLVLWSENPRDPIEGDVDNNLIIDRALNEDDTDSRWELNKLAKEMGEEFDFSELPTVARIEDSDKYQVYDGNRRVILAMLRNLGYDLTTNQISAFPLFPNEIPCNVCSREKALSHVFRKHKDSGSWKPYERDLFASRYMGQKKSVLVRIEELVDGISLYPALNQRFVKEDVLNDKHLKELGLDPDKIDYGIPQSLLLEIIAFVASETVPDGRLTTRNYRNDPIAVFPEELLKKIKEITIGDDEEGLFDPNNPEVGKSTQGNRKSSSSEPPSNREKAKSKQKTRVKKHEAYEIFGSSLFLKTGDVNNIYRTLDSLWQLNENGKIASSESFIQIFRMGLRLLVETAAHDEGISMDDYIEKYFASAKKNLSADGNNDIKTFLYSQSVEKEKMRGLLHIGAHEYSAAGNKDQAIAISIIVGSMLQISHERSA